MRISTSMIYDLGLASLQQQTSDLVKLQQQVSTGSRMLAPSDDPVAAARLLDVTQSLQVNKQFSTNQTSAQNSLQQEESILSSVSSLIQDVKTTAVNAGNSVLSNADRASLATALQGSFNELLGLANSTDGTGQYMFSGYRGTTAPFSLNAAGQVNYNGDQGQRLLMIGANRQIPVSDSGSDVFQRIKNGNGTFVTSPNGTLPLNTGTGVISPGTLLNINSWNSPTNSQNFSIKFAVNAGVTTYDIVDNVSGKSLLTGAPAAAGPYLRTYTSGSTISLKTQAPPDTNPTPFDYGAELSIQGAPANGDSFTVKASTNQDLFQTISNLISTLNTPINGASDQAALANGLNSAMSNLDNGLNNVLTAQAAVGARLKELDSVQTVGQSRQLQYQQVISQLGDLDYTKAISDFTQKQTALEAAQKSFLKVQGLSLFNYM